MQKQSIASGDLLITNGSLVLPNRILNDGMVGIRNGRIVYVGKRKRFRAAEIIDAEGGSISPGFIDIHVHGGAGYDFMDGTTEAVQQACLAHLRHGTTTLFPTTTTAPAARILQMIAACRDVQCQTKSKTSTMPTSPKLPGIHLYGPYFAEGKTGCHSPSDARAPEVDEFTHYFASKMIRIATCAAELPGAASFYRAARRSRCLITCGHSNASWPEMEAAFRLGMRHVDHFWCAMSSIASLRQRFGVPMQASMAEFVLMHREMSTEVIADGCHLSPELLEFAYRMKGAERLCLVTDCNRALDMPPGDYRFGNCDDGVLFHSDGNVGWAENGSLASAVRGMDHMVRTMYQATSATLPEVIRMASLTPAERTNIDRWTGSLVVDKRADVIVLDQDLAVSKVIVRGQLQTDYPRE